MKKMSVVSFKFGGRLSFVLGTLCSRSFWSFNFLFRDQLGHISKIKVLQTFCFEKLEELEKKQNCQNPSRSNAIERVFKII